MQNKTDMQQVDVVGILAKTMADAFSVQAWKWAVGGMATLAMAVLPDEGVRVAVGISLAFVLLDFITGVIAASVKGEAIRSAGIKRTVIKCTGYVIAVAVVYVALHQVTQSMDIARIFGTLLANVILLTEAVSILENLDKAGVSLPGWVVRLLSSHLHSENEKAEQQQEAGDAQPR